MSGTSPVSKVDQSVQESCKSKINKCQWDNVHQFSLHRKKKKPAVICLVNFPDSGEICGCYSKLVLRSSDINSKDFSKQLCTLLGMDESYLFIEGDGLTKKGASRLSSLLSSALKLFDGRLTVVIFCEKSLSEGAIKKMVEKDFDANSQGDDMKSPNNKKLKRDSFEKKGSELKEAENIHLERSVDDKMSEKDLHILKLKEELVSEKKKFDEKDALNKTEKEELKETLDKVVQAAGEEVLANQNLQEKLKAADETIKEIRKAKEEFEVLANDHLRERNFRVKEAESKEQEILGLKKVVDDKNNLINELELKCKEVDTLNESMKHLEDSLKEKEIVIDTLKIQIEASQGQLCIAKNVLTEENQESRKQELESTKPEEKNDQKNRVKSVQEEIKKNRSLFPKAGSSEIIRRSIKSFCCLENFLVVESGLFECTIKVVKPVSGIEQLSPFKGSGKSKKKAKKDAFDNYLSSIMSCI